MQKDTFIAMMIAESLAALISAALLFSDMGAIIYLCAAAVYAAVLTPFALRLKKQPDEAKKRKIRRNMALILAIPIAAAVVSCLTVVIGLMLYYGF